jgi:starch synthase
MKKLCIVFAASEALPFVKTGGLADVVYALSRELVSFGHELHLFLPRYYKIDKTKWKCRLTGGPLGVPIGNGERWASLYECDGIPGVKTHFIEHDDFFGRDGLYDDGYSAFGDNADRFTFYCRAVMQACLSLNISPDILHCNDWQTGLIPIYAKTLYKLFPNFAHTKSVMTIHNIGYQGVFNKEAIALTQLGWEAYNEDCLQFYQSINFLKGGLLWADAITTVSKTYAREIQTSEYGYDLAGVLHRRREQLFGITNGVDYGSWDPAHDEHLPVTYTPSRMRGKLLCKEHLQNEMKLRVNPDVPLMATITRVTHQKGIDILVRAIESLILKLDFQFVLLGSGDSAILDKLDELKREYPDRIALSRGYNEPLAHRIEAGADIYLMPSRYEPCGLNQMYSLRYGTIPVVRATGGLDDTVDEWDAKGGEGTGFKFRDATIESLAGAILKANALYREKESWETIRRNAMHVRLDWREAVAAYEQVYGFAIHGPGHLL